MTFSQAETLSAKLLIAANQAILDARLLEDEADTLKNRAEIFREQAQLLADADHILWSNYKNMEEQNG